MRKKTIFFCISIWGIGMILALISRFVFFNDNDIVWNINKYYNEVICILSLIPVAPVILIVDMIRTQKVWIDVLLMLLLLLCFFIYICIWVACTGGV